MSKAVRIEHVGIMVTDLERSIRFYEETVGLKLKGQLLHSNGVTRLAFMGLGREGETEVELIQRADNQVAKEGRVHHVAFTVEDIEAEHERIGSLNLSGYDTSITDLPNGSRYFFFDGPDGERIEFFQTDRK